jgi:parallel beta-helix repeat protein
MPDKMEQLHAQIEQGVAELVDGSRASRGPAERERALWPDWRCSGDPQARGPVPSALVPLRPWRHPCSLSGRLNVADGPAGQGETAMTRKCALVLALALTVGFAPRAEASHRRVRCGDVISRSTVLRNDLTCDGDGLVIGADNVTLDLDGHSITGRRGDGSVGIENAGRDEVTIKNGFVNEFERGVVLRAGANRNRLEGLRTDGHRVYGIVLFNSNNNLLKQNGAVGNGTLSAGNLPEACLPIAQVGGGIFLFDSQGNRLDANVSQVNSGYGLALFGSARNRLERNEAGAVGSDGNGCGGIYLLDSDDNRLRRNVAAEDVLDGIFIDSRSSGNRLERNLADSRGTGNDDGIDVENKDTTIKGNTATNNGDLGIEAVRGVTDGGGNRASGNGDPRQCINVRCRPAT